MKKVVRDVGERAATARPWPATPAAAGDAWEGFAPGRWQTEIDVRGFIQRNYTPYEGDGAFLAGPTERTRTLWAKVLDLLKEEQAKGGVLDADTEIVSNIDSHGPGYIDRDLEKIFGLQTDKPLKRAIMPYGGIRMVQQALEAYGYKLSPAVETVFTHY